MKQNYVRLDGVYRECGDNVCQQHLYRFFTTQLTTASTCTEDNQLILKTIAQKENLASIKKNPATTIPQEQSHKNPDTMLQINNLSARIMNNTSNTEDEYARTEDNDFVLETIQRVGCSNQDSVSSMRRRLIQTKVEFHSNSKSHL